ncbi:MAG: hypothetical protein JWN93_1354 [Hyphomicrobiales bacterium]|nr:hypothetical protein [Hyphomicrobiales bacterium]
MSHKYKLNQMVRLARLGFTDSKTSPAGLYEVTRLMPADQTGEYSYRIKASGAGERAVRESELSPSVAET